MKPPKLFTSIFAVVCLFAVCGARAQLFVTNAVTFSAITFNQGPTNTVTSGTNTIMTFGPTKTKSYNDAALLQEIGQAISSITVTNPFSSSARLVLLTAVNSSNSVPNFAVIDGTNYYDLSVSNYNFMNFSFPVAAQITTGSVSPDGQKNETQSIPISVVYDDRNLDLGTLTFTLNGIVTSTETITASDSGTFTDTVKGKISGMTGSGTSGGNPFTATGSISFGGSGKFSAD